MRAITKLALLLALAIPGGLSCRPRINAPTGPSAQIGAIPNPADHNGGIMLAEIATWAGNLAGFALIGSIILFAIGQRKLAGDIALAAGAVLICAPILQWADRNLWWLAIVAAIFVLAFVCMYIWHKAVPVLEEHLWLD